MELRDIGTEALKYSVTGFAGFGFGAAFGKLAAHSPFETGALFTVAFIASRALNKIVRNIALKHDFQLSTYHIVKRVADTALKLAVAVSLFAMGVFSTTGLIFAGGVALAFCAVDISVGVYLKYSQQDDLLDDIVVDKQTPWFISHAYA